MEKLSLDDGGTVVALKIYRSQMKKVNDKYHSSTDCVVCGKTFVAYTNYILKGRATCCSKLCRNRLGGSSVPKEKRTGKNNGNWKGGISTNNVHYKNLYTERHPEKRQAQRDTYYLIRRGKIVRGDCIVCGKKNAHAHHNNYNDIFDITWLCQKHHNNVHSGSICLLQSKPVQTEQSVVLGTINECE